MTSKRLFIPGEPVAKARPRVTRSGHAYTPKKTELAERAIRNAWIEKYSEEQMSGPLKVHITFLYEVPKSWPKWKREQAERYTLPKITKPDTDNLVKTVMDALNGIAYKDDSVVYEILARKKYAPAWANGTQIVIMSFDDGQDKEGRDWYWMKERKVEE